MPGNYNDPSSRMSMNMHTVYDIVQAMAGHLQAIDDAWDDTMKAWDQLKLSWAGQTEQEVDGFQTGVQRVYKEIFGTTKPSPTDPTKQVTDQPGLVQQARELAAAAVESYNWTDYGVAEMFYQSAVNTTGQNHNMGAGPDGTNVIVTPQSPPSGPAPSQTRRYIAEIF